ncbi:MAG TPA: hypothetical protein VF747_08785 [Blastocatellia bacterium]|jgi:hypothetical protein
MNRLSHTGAAPVEKIEARVRPREGEIVDVAMTVATIIKTEPASEQRFQAKAQRAAKPLRIVRSNSTKRLYSFATFAALFTFA